MTHLVSSVEHRPLKIYGNYGAEKNLTIRKRMGRI